MNNNQITEKYLIERGVREPKGLPNKDIILGSDELLSKVAGLDLEALTALIQARVDDNREELVMTALPPEVFVLRQIMVELVAVLGDQAGYKAEHERRLADKASAPTPEVILPPEDSSANEESSV